MFDALQGYLGSYGGPRGGRGVIMSEVPLYCYGDGVAYVFQNRVERSDSGETEGWVVQKLNTQPFPGTKRSPQFQREPR